MPKATANKSPQRSGKRARPASAAGEGDATSKKKDAAGSPAKKATKSAEPKAAKKTGEKKPRKKADKKGDPSAASSAEKRQAALAAILPQSTSDRMADAARASVYAISSEKTLEQIHAVAEQERNLELERADGLADLLAPTPSAEVRRSPRDQFAFLRTELQRGEEDPDDPHTAWRLSGQRLRHELFPGISPEELRTVEQRLHATLPPSYWDFSLEWSGGTLFVQSGGGYRVIPAQEILDEIKGPLCNRIRKPYLPVVDLGCGDYLALDISRATKSGETPLVWWYGGEVKKKVAESFALWLKKLVELKGQPYWWAAERA